MAGRIAPIMSSTEGPSWATWVGVFLSTVMMSSQGSFGAFKQQSCAVVMESSDHRPADRVNCVDGQRELSAGTDSKAYSSPTTDDKTEVVLRLNDDQSQLVVGEKISEDELAELQPRGLAIHPVTPSTDNEDRIEGVQADRNAVGESQESYQMKAHKLSVGLIQDCHTSQKDEDESGTSKDGETSCTLSEDSLEIVERGYYPPVGEINTPEVASGLVGSSLAEACSLSDKTHCGFFELRGFGSS